MTRATVVSIVPLEINETKVGLFPGNFHIDAYDEPLSTPLVRMIPRVLHVGSSKHFVYVGDSRPTVPVPNLPFDIAKSIVEDYVSSMIGVKSGAKPGLFALEEEVQSEEVAKKFPKPLGQARELQLAWFRELLDLAYSDWMKFQRPNAISDLQKKVTILMGHTDAPWMIVSTEPPQTCPACQSLVNPKAVVCPTCRAILNEDGYKLHKFADISR